MPENLYPQLPTVPLMNQESFNIEMVRKYYQDIANLKEKYTEKQSKYKNAYNRLLHASTGASSVALASGVSTIGMSVIVVGLPISASLGVVSTVSTCVGACLLLTSKKYKKKLLKCCELLDKITTSLATFDTLISLSLDDGNVIDAKEFHKLQTSYLASTGASSFALASGISTVGTSVTVVGLPISASLGVVSTVSTCVGACLLLTSKKYKKKLLKCYELLDKITTSLATVETLISLSIESKSR